jgi:23S rRNA pseudouridine955/2504/2580 synthase
MVKDLREIPVLFENNFCLVLNKPSGLSVQGGEGLKTSLDSILSEKIHPRPFLVHRLDRDTSGIVLVAKTREAARDFSFLFGGKDAGLGIRKIKSQYRGLCLGIPEKKQGSIRIDLDVRGAKKESETSFRLLSTFTQKIDDEELSFSFLELELETGRLHQIRRHLALLGSPLLGDDKYGIFPLNRKLKKRLGLKNLLLHASRLVIPPIQFRPGGLDVSAPLPDYFSRFLGAQRT